MSSYPEQEVKRIGKQSDSILINLPIYVGLAVLVFTELADWIRSWISEAKVPRGGFMAFILGIWLEIFLYQIIPFVVITFVVKRLFKKRKSQSEIIIRLASMLIPVSLLTPYWLLVHVDPFARGALLFMNLFLVFIGYLLGSVIYVFIQGSRGNGA